MARYIDAEKLKAQLQDFSNWCRDGRKQGVDFVLDCPLPNTPTADVQEVRHGKWYDATPKAFCACSHCGGGGHKHYKFCPWCGAKMDEEEKE